jgi:pilus assembly protein CpaF
VRHQIGSAIDIIVQLKRTRDGRRVVSQISECVGVNPRTERIELRDLYLLEPNDDTGQLQPTGRLPTFIGELIQTEALDLSHFYH